MHLIDVAKRKKRVSIFFKVQELSAEERQMCREALRNLLGKIFQPIVIKELLILQGGAKKVCISV